MPTYKLILSEGARGVQKRVEFEGQNAAAALNVLEGEGDARNAELWVGDTKLARITRDRTGLWIVEPAKLTAA